MDKEITLSTCAFPVAPSDEAGLIEHFLMAQEAGFSGFELAIVPDDCAEILCRAAVKSKVNVVAVHGILDGNSCSPDETLRNRSVERAYRYLANMTDFAPCPLVEHYHNRFNAPEYAEYFHDTVEKLLSRTEKDGFIFCMENAPYKPEYDERFPNVAEIVDFVRSFGENRMFMTFDVNHANLHEDPVAVAQISAGYVRHIHVSDNHGYREEHMLPGKGTIDLAAVISALYRNGYTGPCNLEVVFPKDSPADAAGYRELFNYMKALNI